jgi:hypothetical protein
MALFARALARAQDKYACTNLYADLYAFEFDAFQVL